MSLSDRRTLLIALAGLPLAAGCGFSPAYAPDGPGMALRGNIRADDPADRDGFDLVERLEERLGRPRAAAYALSYIIEVTEQQLARTAALRESRVQLSGSVGFELRPTGGGAALTGGTVSNFTGYSTTSTPLANRAGAEDARRRLMHILADQIVTRLTATVPDWAAERAATSGLP